MSTPHITFPTPPPTLRLKRTAERRATQLCELQAALQQREQELQAYEQRLRAMHEELTQGAAAVRPMSGDDAHLAAAWSKLHRARELLEEEQRQLCSDRVALHSAREALSQREQQLIAREAAVAEAEQRLQAAAPAPKAKKNKADAVLGLTRAPFALARSVLRKS